MENSHIRALSTVSQIKKRLEHLSQQRQHLSRKPFSLEAPSPFSCKITELLQKLQREENYLIKEACKLKETLHFSSSSPLSLDSPEISSMISYYGIQNNR
ncbi:hypothetical protein NEFER03_1070 [Nematocida sp. LUAm3]|nr:hypothetical protein NEFER03_1070 [Nematocida sp. LUAm3]KAI5175325.1 hypothetical protein NEFER02_1254 [Nematocida sp. LUAm2]KAI5177718.1 hypothetical protein NEFER01_0942 [Nematocida sp. LUAm1]